MTKEKLKEEFINSFGEEKWKQEEMLLKLMSIHKKLAKYLDVEMIPVVCEDIEEDSRFYFKEQYIIISPLMLEKYSDAAKSLIHEVRHQYQQKCINDPNTKENPDLVRLWKEDMPKLFNPLIYLNLDGKNPYLSNVCELDAHAFSKWYLKEKYDIETHYPQFEYDALLDLFAEKYYKNC